jgi:PRC-barrel domain
MRTVVLRWRSFAGGVALAAGMLFGAMGLMALAQNEIQDELIGASVYAAGGIEVGEVSAVTVGEDGQIAEIRVTTAYPLGFGQRTVVLQRGSFLALRGAVVLDISAEEFGALPGTAALRGTLAQGPADGRLAFARA